MKVLLVDDTPMVFSELQAVMSVGVELHLVLAAGVGSARAVLAIDAGFDLVLITLGSAVEHGVALLAELRVEHPSLPVVVLSPESASTPAQKESRVGALAVLASLSKDLFPAGAGSVRQSEVDLEELSWRFRSTAQASLRERGLTPRQQQVLALILEGKSNKAIARVLHLSVDTVKDHVTAVMRSLKVRSRTQAVLAVTRLQGTAMPSLPSDRRPFAWASAATGTALAN